MTFKAEQEKISTLFHSSSHYATQDFYNDKDGRTLLMSWMRDNTSAFLLDNKYWHGIQSIPYVTTLVTVDGKMKLHLEMPEEIEGICKDALVELGGTVIDGSSTVKAAESKSAVIELKAKLDKGESVTLKLRASDAHYVDLVCSYSSAGKVSVVLDASNSSDKVIRQKITATVLTDADGYFSLDILLDNCVIEVFTNDGNVLSDFFFADEDGDGISISAAGQVDIAEYNVFAA
jgi:sucrose-6-phosphate hydrolase SacC (GH32 family)